MDSNVALESDWNLGAATTHVKTAIVTGEDEASLYQSDTKPNKASVL